MWLALFLGCLKATSGHCLAYLKPIPPHFDLNALPYELATYPVYLYQDIVYSICFQARHRVSTARRTGQLISLYDVISNTIISRISRFPHHYSSPLYLYLWSLPIC